MNIIELGIDVSGFTAEKEHVLNRFIELFNLLEKYDGKIYNPVMGEGLVAFNSSLTATTKLLDELGAKMAALQSNPLGAGMEKAAAATTAVATATKNLATNLDASSASQAKSVQQSDMQARINATLGITVENINRSIEEQKEIEAANTAEKMKAVTVLKQYAIEQEKQEKTSILEKKQREKEVEAQNNAEKMRAVETLRLLAIEQDREEKRQIVTQKQQEKEAERALNEEKMRVVTTLRLQAIEQDKAEKAANLAKKKQQKEAERELKEEEQQRTAALRAQAAQEEIEAKALAAEAAEVERLANKYQMLLELKAQQKENYANAFLNTGANSDETKAALAELQATSEVTREIEGNLARANKGVSAFGEGARGAFGMLRQLAYILPGIGIAGLFNLAFEAIEKAAEELGLFNTELEKADAFEKLLNEHLLDQFNNYKSLNDQKEKYYQITNQASSSNINRDQTNQDALGRSSDISVEGQRAVAYTKLTEIKTKIDPKFNDLSVEQTKAAAQKLIEEQEGLDKKLKGLQGVIDDPTYKKNASASVSDAVTGATGTLTVLPAWLIRATTDMDKPVKEVIEKEKSALELRKALNAETLDNLQTFVERKSDLQKIDNEIDKKHYDEQLKLKTETTRENTSLNIERNKTVLSDDTTTESQRISAIKQIHNLEVKNNHTEEQSVEKDRTSTDTDIKIAKNKEYIENLKSNINKEKDIHDTRVQFYQRELTATTEVKKSELLQEALTNEKIANNEKETVEKRLAALIKYFDLRKQIQRTELDKDLQKGADHEGGKTSLLPQEVIQLGSQEHEEEASITADARSKVYNIFHDYAQKQLKDVKDLNIESRHTEDEGYITALNHLNKSLEDRTISYETYSKRRKYIDEQYQKISLDHDILNDKRDLSRLYKLSETNATDITNANTELNTAKQGGNKEEIDKAQGKVDATVEAKGNIDKTVTEAENRLQSDRLKRAKIGNTQLIDVHKLYANEFKKIMSELLDSIKTIVDAEYEVRISRIEKTKQMFDEQADAEIAAVDKSSLSLKDKQALEIQLDAEKNQRDKTSDAEVRNLKRDQAIFDREMTIAKILWATEEAVVNALALPLPMPAPEIIAAERGAAGAVAVATVLATPMPAYAEGTDNHPGGVALFGEAGPEVVKEPYKSPYLVLKETISYLPKGTEVIPIKEMPEFGQQQDDGWEQTRWLAKQLNKSKKEIKNVFSPTINVNLGFEMYKKTILGN